MEYYKSVFLPWHTTRREKESFCLEVRSMENIKPAFGNGIGQN